MNRRLLTLVLLVIPLIAVAQTRSKPAPVPPTKPAADEQLYRNTNFGFRFQIPYGWVDRTREMREGDSPDKGDAQPEKPETKEKSAGEKAGAQGDVLLAVF